ncbi:MAG: hypothetical protein ACTSUQ_01795 [Candidatus Freyarchaeota archaeon]
MKFDIFGKLIAWFKKIFRIFQRKESQSETRPIIVQKIDSEKAIEEKPFEGKQIRRKEVKRDNLHIQLSEFERKKEDVEKKEEISKKLIETPIEEAQEKTETGEYSKIFEGEGKEIEVKDELTAEKLEEKKREGIVEKKKVEKLEEKEVRKKVKPYKKKFPTEPARKRKKLPVGKQKTPPAVSREVDLGERRPTKQKRDLSPQEERERKSTEPSTRVAAPFVEVNFDEAKVFFVIPKQRIPKQSRSITDSSQEQWTYHVKLNDDEKIFQANILEREKYLEIEEKRIELEKPIQTFEVVFPPILNRTFFYKHHGDFIYVFTPIGNDLGKMYYLYHMDRKNPLPKRGIWLLLKEDFELSNKPDVIEERWIWENYQPSYINLKKVNELIVRNRHTGQEERIPCENTFTIEGEELIEDDLKERAPFFTGKSIKIKAPRINPFGWVVWIQNKQADYRIVTENWNGEEELKLELPDDLPCECGEFQIDICEKNEGVPVETLFFRYVPFLQLEYPKEPIVPSYYGHGTESIKVVLGSDFREWELKTHEDNESIENGYLVELPPERDVLHFSINKRNRPETEVRFQITIPRVKWKISNQEIWNDKPLQIKRDELVSGSELYLIVCTNSRTAINLSAILESDDQRLQEGRFSKKGDVKYFLLLNEFYETISNNWSKLTLKVGIDKKMWFDAIHFSPNIKQLERVLDILKSMGYHDIPDFGKTLEQEYQIAEVIIEEKLNNVKEVCEYITKKSESRIYRDLLRQAQEHSAQNNHIDAISNYGEIINNFRGEMRERLKSLRDEIEKIKESNRAIEIFSNEFIKDMVKIEEICSMCPLQKNDVETFYEITEKVTQDIGIIKYKLNKFWALFIFDIKNPGYIKYLSEKWKFFKDRDGSLDNISDDFDEKYIFEPLRENDEIRRAIFRFYIPNSLNDLNLDFRLNLGGFAQRDKELAKNDAKKFLDKLLKIKKRYKMSLR